MVLSDHNLMWVWFIVTIEYGWGEDKLNIGWHLVISNGHPSKYMSLMGGMLCHCWLSLQKEVAQRSNWIGIIIIFLEGGVGGTGLGSFCQPQES